MSCHVSLRQLVKPRFVAEACGLFYSYLELYCNLQVAAKLNCAISICPSAERSSWSFHIIMVWLVVMWLVCCQLAPPNCKACTVVLVQDFACTSWDVHYCSIIFAEQVNWCCCILIADLGVKNKEGDSYLISQDDTLQGRPLMETHRHDIDMDTHNRHCLI